MSDIKKIRENFIIKIKENLDLNQINQIKSELFGKNGLIPSQFKKLSLVAENERKQFDVPISSFQLTQDKLVWMLSEITKGQLLALQVGKNKDNKTLHHAHVSMLKRNNVWVARECIKLAREILGANGITQDYPIMRHMMNIESVYTYEGTHDMHTLILGNDITDIPSFE